jgi:hypothetical protein
VLFTYSVAIPDRSEMQMVEITISSPFTEPGHVLMVNVATLAVVGKSLEQTLVEHVEHQQRLTQRQSSGAEGDEAGQET